jgi:HEAT repeat protein
MISCIPSEPEKEIELTNTDLSSSSDDELIDEWLAMAQNPSAYVGAIRTFELIDTLNSKSETALTPIIEKLGDPESTPELKLFVLQCVNINMTPAYIPVLTPLLKKSYPASTRACATQLLGGIESEEVVPFLKQALADESPNVVFTAKSGLAVQNVGDYRKEFLDLYEKSETDTLQKAEILRVIMYSPSEGGMTDQEFSVLAEAIIGEDTPIGVRSAIAMLFIESEKPAALDSIKESIRLSDDDLYKQLVQSTLDKRTNDEQKK